MTRYSKFALHSTLGIVLSLILMQSQAQNSPIEHKKKNTTDQEITAPVNSSGVISKGIARSVTGEFIPPPQTPANRYMSIPNPSGLNQRAHTSLVTELVRDQDSGLPVYLKSADADAARRSIVSKNAASQAAFDFLDEIKSLIPVENPLAEFEVKHVNLDTNGYSHIKLQQTLEGIPVYASEVMVHFTPGQEAILNGRYQPTPVIENLVPAITHDLAIQYALQDIATHTSLVELSSSQQQFLNYDGPQPELVIYRVPGYIMQHRLAWHITIRPNFIERWEYFVDAHNGTILHQYNHTCEIGPVTGTSNDLSGTSRTVHSFEYAANSFVMIDMSRDMFHGSNTNPQSGDGYIVTFDMNNSNVENNPTYNYITSGNKNSWNATAVSAHHHAGIAYEYFRNNFGRISIDGDSGDIVSFINVQDNNGAMDNAFWNGVAMFYGNGNQAFSPLAASLDVGGHEMTHGVVQSTANLEYQGQSGALNESFADIFAVMIDRDDWLLGDDVVNTSFFPSGALRSMSDPHNGGTNINDNGFQPKHMNELYTGSQDNGGVHINSGIPNHAFYLIATAIGKEKAEQIFYKALVDWLTASSQFVDLRIGVEGAANQVAGITTADKNAIADAFAQVGIGQGSGGGNNGQNYQPQLPVNPGQDFIVSTDVNVNDPVDLYISSTSGTNFQALSQTEPDSKISVSDDGSTGYFVGTDEHIYGLFLDPSNPQEQTLSTNAEWDNVAISKDGTRLAAVSTSIDTSIYVFNLAANPITGVKFRLYNPTFAQGGINTGDVLYADAITWDYSGEYVLYDAFNQIKSNAGDDLEYWDVGFIRVWNNSTNTFGDGTVSKLFNGLSAGESVLNPTFSQNSPAVIGFDYYNGNTNEVKVMGANTETNDVGTIFNNQILGYPSYSKTDDKVIFNALSTQSDEIIAEINLASDKINSTGSASGLIADGKWGVWYATGSRDISIGLDDQWENDGRIRLFPNPAADMTTLEFQLNKPATIAVDVMDLTGKVLDKLSPKALPAGTSSITLPMHNYADGTYIIRVNAGTGMKIFRLVKL